MKILIKFILLIPIIILIIFGGIKIIKNLNQPSLIRAFGDLKVDFGNPPVNPGDPVFVVSDFKPGDCESREIKVTNDGTLARLISVKGNRTGGVGDDPKLEGVLDLVISENGTDLYGGNAGTRTVVDFFTASTDPNGVKLSIVNSQASKTYIFKVCFPSSATNEFQEKSVIFDLIFGVITGNNLVINEVYYWPDKSHGTDGQKDCSKEGNALNKNTGAGSVNSATTININSVNVKTTQNGIVSNNVQVNSNTGGITNSNNTNSSNPQTGSSSSNINITNNVNNSTVVVNCGATSDEWIELFNPTDQDISLKNWTLEDNTGKKSIINAKKIIKAGEFAWVVKSASTKKYWNIPKNTLIIELGNWIGDGLDNDGDHIVLRDPKGLDIDNIGWGTDTASGVIHTSGVSQGHSLERLVPGFDTDSGSDFKTQFPPTPGQ